MSIIAVIIHDSGSLIMGDTKLNDNPQITKIRKIFKKENILLGYTGNVREVNQYLFPIFNPDMTLNPNYCFENPIDFIQDLDKRFENAVLHNVKYDVVFAIIAKISSKYVAKRYCLSDANELYVTYETLVSNNDIQYFILGDERHIQFFDKYIDENPPSSFADFIIAFQKTLDNGILFDNQINNILQYEQI